MLVGTGVTTIASNKVTDERTYCMTYPGSITAGDLFYVDANGRLARLAKGTANMVLQQGATIPAWAATLAGITLTSPTLTTPSVSGQLKATGTDPTVAVNTLVVGSTGSGVVDYGSDTSFQLTITCAGTGYTTGRVCTVTFAAAKASTNYNVFIQEISSDAAGKHFRVTSRTTTTFEIHTEDAPAAGESLVLHVLVIENV